ncbi:MAG: TIGR04211 family SH3 domain-containing protein [Spongiibacteraceae bacterium]
MKKSVQIGILSTLILAAGNAYAATRYISDQVHVPLRVGDSAKHRIIHRGLPSGEKIELLKSNEKSGYSLVRTDKNIEGWLPSHYLVTQPVAKLKLAKAVEKIKSLSNSNASLKKQLQDLSSKSSESIASAKAVAQKNEALASELEDIQRVSGNALKLDQDNRVLIQENQKLSNDVDVLRTDNTRLRENKENEFFLNGAFAVLIGVMIALIVPRMLPKKSSDWV